VCASARILPEDWPGGGAAGGPWAELGPDLVRRAPWGVLLVDAGGRVRSANPAAERMLGASPGLLPGCDLTDPHWRTLGEDGAPCPPDDHPQRQAARTRQETRRVLGVYSDATGSYRWLDVHAVPDLRAADARGPVPVLLMLLDVSDRLAQAAALRAATDRLRAAERSDALGQLTAGIAHDFNNLLSIINGFAEMLHGDLPDADPRKDDVGQIRDAGRRGAALVNQLMAFSRQKPGQPRPIDLHAAVAAMEPLLRRLVGAHVVLDLPPACGAATAMADPSEFEQVVINLAANARDAMPNGGRLTIGTSAVTLFDPVLEPLSGLPPGPYVVLAVCDTGHGMDEATRARIFEPFFTTKGPGTGTGLGLATVHRVVTQGGGRVVVESEVRAGTTFLVYLPGTAVPEDATAAVAAPSGPTRAPAGTTVLLVEDDPEVRELTRRMLASAGYKVRAAADGDAAVQLLTVGGATADLVLMDVSLPGGSGADVARRLAALVPGVRVLFMSGYTDESVEHLGVAGGEAAFIGKPFTLAGLTAKVREVLGH